MRTSTSGTSCVRALRGVRPFDGSSWFSISARPGMPLQKRRTGGRSPGAGWRWARLQPEPGDGVGFQRGVVPGIAFEGCRGGVPGLAHDLVRGRAGGVGVGDETGPQRMPGVAGRVDPCGGEPADQDGVDGGAADRAIVDGRRRPGGPSPGPRTPCRWRSGGRGGRRSSRRPRPGRFSRTGSAPPVPHPP